MVYSEVCPLLHQPDWGYKGLDALLQVTNIVVFKLGCGYLRSQVCRDKGSILLQSQVEFSATGEGNFSMWEWRW